MLAKGMDALLTGGEKEMSALPVVRAANKKTMMTRGVMFTV